MFQDRTIPRDKVVAEIIMADGEKFTGNIFIDIGARLADFLNENKQFFVVIKEGGPIMVNKRYVKEVRPIQEKVGEATDKKTPNEFVDHVIE